MILYHFIATVQVPDQPGRHGSLVPVPHPAGGGRGGLQAGLPLLRTLLRGFGGRCALCALPEGSV